MRRRDDPDAQLLQALADPMRLAIVRQLAAERETCACDLTVCIELSQPTVSHHLRVLREAGLVDAERRGTWVYYTLRRDTIERLARLARELTPAGLGAAIQAPPGEALPGRRLPVIGA
jgi:ArsR family transcriptional regulator, arsenate/arsenite/antimonite-responsive transcriptional repressor